MLPDQDPALVAARSRTDALRTRAMARYTAIRARAEEFPDSFVARIAAEAAGSVVAAAHLAANAIDKDESQRHCKRCREVTRQALAALDEERLTIAQRFGSNQEHARALFSECVLLEVEIMTQTAVDMLLWAEGYAERAWTEAVRRLEELPA